MIEELICNKTKEALISLYNATDIPEIAVQKTRKEFAGDYTVVMFPFLKLSRKNPETTAQDIGIYLKNNLDEVTDFNVIKGFLNLSINESYWQFFINVNYNNEAFGRPHANKPSVFVVEYSSPNTNKPLHLGHIRNNLLGYAVAEILAFAGHKVFSVNLVNDRGIHICKSMLAWQLWGKGETPQTSGIKGDFLAGKYYVLFEQHYKKEVDALTATGMPYDDALKNTPLIKQAQDMLIKWENKDEAVLDLWKTMNHWVMEGFEETYAKLGVAFDKTYFESETYLLGKQLVDEGLRKDVFYRKPDNSVWIDLTDEGLDEKLLLRGDGTSVYITQDLGTALLRKKEFNADHYLYVVGNEQNYHFDVLKKMLKRLGEDWAEGIFHLSYGMVELPEGKMKSREGKVVDADDLIKEMIDTACKHTQELGKTDGFTEVEAQRLYNILAMGALKFFILKVDPKKNMIFNPQESIDFNGHTGPFIQYACVRIQSLLKKAEESGYNITQPIENIQLADKEKTLLKWVHDFPSIVIEAAEALSPALIANYLYEGAKEYNQFYHEFPVIKETDKSKALFRIKLSALVGVVMKNGLKLLGIDVPERM